MEQPLRRIFNPPYAVKSFKSHLKLHDNDFRLLDAISNDGGEIETLFVERIAQLLKPGGLAAVILPSSILSNDSSSYNGAREELLSHFYLRKISWDTTGRIAGVTKESSSSMRAGCFIALEIGRRRIRSQG